MGAGRAHSVLLRVAPPIPCSLNRRFDKVEPLVIAGIVGRRRQREQFPPPVIEDDCHHRLSAGPANVPIWAWVVRVGGHQSLLDGEDEIVRGVQCCRCQGRIVATKANLERADRLA